MSAAVYEIVCPTCHHWLSSRTRPYSRDEKLTRLASHLPHCRSLTADHDDHLEPQCHHLPTCPEFCWNCGRRNDRHTERDHIACQVDLHGPMSLTERQQTIYETRHPPPEEGGF